MDERRGRICHLFILTEFFRARSHRYEVLPILYMPVSQTGQVPQVAARPFFIVTCSAFCISRFSLHFRQYAVTYSILQMAMSHSCELPDQYMMREVLATSCRLTVAFRVCILFLQP